MAYDKVVDSTQLEAAITATANAIREKTGNTALIEWLTSKGFADSIAAIETGGGITLPPTITHFAVDTYTTTVYGISSVSCGHSLGVKPTLAILVSAIPRVVESTDTSYLESCFTFGSGCIFLSFSATGSMDGTTTYANLNSVSTSKKNTATEMTDSRVHFIANGKFYSQIFLVITMRWEQEQ